MLCFAVVDQPT